jgi:cell wall-associated NlpC family hydrolase
MSDKGRSPSKLLVFALALPVFAIVYMTSFGGRLWAALRPAVATFLGAGVIASVYGETAYQKAPGPVRAGAVVALAVALVFPSFSAPATVAAADPAEAVINAAQEYLGKSFQLGAEGPKQFDCSGLVYRAFADAGELPRIGGMRLRAAGYMQYFVSRGRFTQDESEARRGDLIIWDKGEHIGIYLGDGKAISALVDPWGVSIHHLHTIHLPLTYFLHVNWGNGDADNTGDPGHNNGGGNGNGNGNGGNGNGNNGKPDNGGNGNGNGNGGNGKPDGNGDGDGDGNGEGVRPGDGADGLALGTMNLRTAGDPSARIVGWIGRGGTFKIVDQGMSPSGYLWYQVETKSGKQGWVFGRWVKPLS